MVKRVLDTSVIVKWFFSEEGTERAEAFLIELEQESSRALVPSSLFYEFSNVLWVKRREGLQQGPALTIWHELVQLPLTVVDWEDLLPGAISFGFLHEVSPYDAALAVLAQSEECDFITADVPLWRKLHQKFPWVKQL
jgi:predicted nucleic acid-binding protein